MSAPKRIVITGAGGLIGWHAAARLHAENCGAGFRGETLPYDVTALGRAGFNDDAVLEGAVADADAVLHFAGVNRASEGELEEGNPDLAKRLVAALAKTGSKATIVYANSTHSTADNPYGRGKKRAADVCAAHASAQGTAFVDLILPHIFGEGGRPFYNNVTGTLCQQIADGETPTVNPDGKVELVHSGEAAQTAIDLGLAGNSVQHRMQGKPIGIPALLEKLQGFHALYTSFIYPDLSDPFDVALFNTYRQHLYPDHFPRAVKVNTDARGRLFEAAKGGGGGQSFISWTEPGVTRGEHFHLHKVERFLVVEGQANISMRKVLTDEVHSFDVTGDAPAYVDMPTLWTHNITNTGDKPLVTLFWTHDIFDPSAPDTFADKVAQDSAT